MKETVIPYENHRPAPAINKLELNNMMLCRLQLEIFGHRTVLMIGTDCKKKYKVRTSDALMIRKNHNEQREIMSITQKYRVILLEAMCRNSAIVLL